MKKSGEQHAEIGDARTSQAWEDTQLVGNILKDRSPFQFEETLQSIIWILFISLCQ